MTIKIVVRNKNSNQSSETLTLEDLLITIGSGVAANVKLLGDEIASEQAVIVNDNGQSLFINQNKGTVLNGKEIDKGFPHKLSSGDSVQIGAYNLIIELEEQFAKAENNYTPSEEFADTNDFSRKENSLSNGSLVSESLIVTNGNVKTDNQTATLSQTDLAKTKHEPVIETFADILSSLRKEEDQFYFQLTENDGSKRRLAIESDEIILGWDSANKIFSSNQELKLDLPQAVIRKDWNGVTIYPNGAEAILVNNVLLEAGSRLRNNDKIVFSRLIENVAHSVTLIFCEPAALVELNAILPQELVSNALEANQSGEITAETLTEQQPEIETNQEKLSAASEKPLKKTRSPFYFGYFTLAEIIIMIIATIFTAVLTYVLLDFS